ncbi:hypothetical protein ACX80W_01745 [Arthrobacter sp. TMN-37]
MRINNAPTNAHQEKALKLRGEYQQWVENIRADRTLSPEGKAQQIARHYLELKPQLERLQAEQNAAQETRLKNLRRELFGMPGTADSHTAIAYRDAMDRAARITDEDEAARLLGMAEMSGDTWLAKAIAARGFQDGWNGVVNAYADQYPASTSKFQELADLEASGGSSASMARLLGEAMTYNVDKPHELIGYHTDEAISAVAAS